MEVAAPKIKKGYKQTEVGVIPEDWVVDVFGSRASIVRGGSPRPIQNYITNSPDGINWIKIGDVGVNERYITSTQEKITDEGSKHSRGVKAGDFLLSNSMSFGRPYILKIDGCIHDGWLAIQDYQDNFETEFLYYVLLSQETLNQYIQFASGSSVLNLNKEVVSKVKLVIPPTHEQKRISNVLSDTDSLIHSLDALIEKKKNIKTATMQQLLTGKTRLPGFSGEWEKVKLGLLLEYIQPQEYLVSSTDYSDAFKTPVLTAGKTFILGYTNEETGIFTDLPCIIFDDFTTDSKFVDFPFKAKSSAMKMLVPKSETVNLKFVFEAIQQIDFKIGDHKRYWISEYQGIEILLPGLKEQDAIVSILGEMNAEITGLEKRRDKLISIKQGMMHELLTGNTRLV